MRPTLVIPDLDLAPAQRWIDALASLPPGSVAVQLRMPKKPARDLLRWGRTLQDLLDPAIPLIVNDRVDVALALGLRAVHLGRGSISAPEARSLLGPGSWVSRSCHDEIELADAAQQGADAALLSPIFASPGKGPPLGLDALRSACLAYPSLAIYALGGVDRSNAPACLAAGAAGVAMIRGALPPG